MYEDAGVGKEAREVGEYIVRATLVNAALNARYRLAYATFRTVCWSVNSPT